jgi:hypothetical protein
MDSLPSPCGPLRLLIGPIANWFAIFLKLHQRNPQIYAIACYTRTTKITETRLILDNQFSQFENQLFYNARMTLCIDEAIADTQHPRGRTSPVPGLTYLSPEKKAESKICINQENDMKSIDVHTNFPRRRTKPVPGNI